MMNSKTTKLITAALAAGTAGFCLRLVLYRTGFDERNILSSSHPLHLACLALAAVLALYLLISLRAPEASEATAAGFPLLRTVCTLAAGGLMILHGITLDRNTGDSLDRFRILLTIVSGICMVLCIPADGRFRTGQILCRGVICLWFTLDMLCRYQNWSGNPQLPDYVFQVFSCALLALVSYHRVAFDTGLSSRRQLLFCSLLGMFLCLTCAAGPETGAFYLGGAFWAGSCIGTPAPRTSAECTPESES